MNTKYNTDIKSSFLACRLCTPFAWTSNIIMNIVLFMVKLFTLYIPSQVELSALDEKILDGLSKACLSLSIICLFVTLFIYIYLR